MPDQMSWSCYIKALIRLHHGPVSCVWVLIENKHWVEFEANFFFFVLQLENNKCSCHLLDQRTWSLSSEVAEAATRRRQIGCVRASSKPSTDFWGAWAKNGEYHNFSLTNKTLVTSSGLMVQLFAKLILCAYKVPSSTPKICAQFWASSHIANLTSAGSGFSDLRR